eukprot:TRINITY_DN7697_c0_g1_i1.p1 TRINITY_DN7697_c0_g1~~TRINITY_DN7697_c0_g1_i1.p1  ORF type:complete len:377 (-),score=35.42 TRINITY_DN7697_c0_g1_i1:261-1391(-)
MKWFTAFVLLSETAFTHMLVWAASDGHCACTESIGQVVDGYARFPSTHNCEPDPGIGSRPWAPQCVCKEGCSCIEAATSCEALYACGVNTSGVYNVTSPAKPYQRYAVYCDFNSGSAGWALVSRFVFADYASDVSTALYLTRCVAASWIKGSADDNDYDYSSDTSNPASTDIPAPMTDALDTSTDRIESHDWRDFLVTGQSYWLRQTFFNGTREVMFDVAFKFTYNGVVLQNDVPNQPHNQAWTLTNRTVLNDTTGITWDVSNDETFLFWLPFRPGFVGAVWSGCYGRSYTTSACFLKPVTVRRRYGSAGIIGAVKDANDPAAAWAPRFGPFGEDVSESHASPVFIHQVNGTGNGFDEFSSSAWGGVTLLYYLRPA